MAMICSSGDGSFGQRVVRDDSFPISHFQVKTLIEFPSQEGFGERIIYSSKQGKIIKQETPFLKKQTHQFRTKPNILISIISTSYSSSLPIKAESLMNQLAYSTIQQRFQ